MAGLRYGKSPVEDLVSYYRRRVDEGGSLDSYLDAWQKTACVPGSQADRQRGEHVAAIRGLIEERS